MGGEEEPLSLLPSEQPLRLRRIEREELFFRAVQRFTIVPDEREEGSLKVRTQEYVYWLHREEHGTYGLLNWHWHPPERERPHIHVSASLDGLGDIEDLHLPTGRVSFEEIVRFLIEEVEVEAIRDDWRETLDEVEQRFRTYRTWA